jgi:large subunit ribosomal protein L10
LPTAEKEAIVDELKQSIEKSAVVVLTQYVGINADQVTDLRRKLREQNVEYKVFKNTLAKRALDDLGFSECVAHMEGPTAWAFCEDPVAPAKILKNFGKEVKFVQMTGGILDGKVISTAELDVLANLPSREQLLAQVVGTIAAPLRNLVGVLSATPRNLVNVLDQIKKQKEEGAAA